MMYEENTQVDNIDMEQHDIDFKEKLVSPDVYDNHFEWNPMKLVVGGKGTPYLVTFNILLNLMLNPSNETTIMYIWHLMLLGMDSLSSAIIFWSLRSHRHMSEECACFNVLGGKFIFF